MRNFQHLLMLSLSKHEGSGKFTTQFAPAVWLRSRLSAINFSVSILDAGLAGRTGSAMKVLSIA